MSVALVGPFRWAVHGDLPQIIRLAPTTVPGFVEHLWATLAGENETAEAFGMRAQAAFIDRGETVVADFHGVIAAFLICYAMPATPAPHVPGMHDLLRPLMELFHLAAGTWYLHGIGTIPQYRGHGLASRLMDVAEAQGHDRGFPAISLLVIDTNAAAISFYLKRGYRETARRPAVKAGWDTTARDWVLMEKPL